MLLETEDGIWARADATVFRLLMNHDRTGRRLQAADRTIASARLRVEALRRRKRAAEAREHAKGARELELELAPAWGKTVRVRASRSPVTSPIKSKSDGGAGVRASLSSTPSKRAIRAYKAPLLDARGRIALYFRIRYVGFSSKSWRPDLAADHAHYILREEALENGEVEVDRAPLSNMGRDAEEIAACWRAIEAIEEGYRANAKVQYRIVWNLPHGLDAEQRRGLVEHFCERTFGRLGLPWVAAVHAPDPRGDDRNYHAHVCFSTRPCERVGDHEWAFAQEKINGLTDAEGLKLIRALAAGHMNTACRAAQLPVRFTHQTYAERGIDAERQQHVGPAATAAHERGESVAVIERNALIVERNELAADRDAAAREAALTDKLLAALAASAGLAAQRRLLEEALSSAQRIVTNVKNLIATRRLHADSTAPVLTRSIEIRAREIAQRIASRQIASRRVPAAAAVSSIGGLTRRVVISGVHSGAHHKALALASDRLEQVRRQIAARAANAAEERTRAARACLLDAPVRPYRLDGGRATLDLTAMTKDDAALVLTLDRENVITTLRQRIRRDQDQDAADARDRARAAEDHRIAEERRRRLVEEACRILREAPKRPYRVEGKVLSLDCSVLSAPDRTTVSVVGIGEPALQQALIERAQRDQAVDRMEAMLEAIERERHYVAREDGRRIVDAAVLDRFGVHQEDIKEESAQVRLETIAAKQNGEVSRIATHVDAHPEHLHRRNGRWTLSEHAPVEVRELVDAWRDDSTMQAALARVAATARPSAEASIKNAPPPAQGAAADGATANRPPGRSAQPDQPDRGEHGSADPASSPSPPRRRWHPGMLGGNGLGG